MFTGTKEFVRILEKYKDTRQVIVYGDPDVDGLVTLLLMCEFCQMLGIKYKYYVNPNRGHGFLLNPEKARDCLVISGDFAITSEKMKELVNDYNIVCLATDHHETEKEFIHIVSDTAEGIMINNQYPFEDESNRYLSGAGVWYELIASIYPEYAQKDRMTMVGITLLSDARAIENKKAEAYLRTTYIRDTSEGYLNYLVQSVLGDIDFQYGVPKLDRNFIDFNLSPTINAMLRYDDTKEAIDFILGKGISTASLDRKQQQRELMSKMNECVHSYDMSNVNIIGVDSADFPDTNITNFIGLYCGKYKEQHGGLSTVGFVEDYSSGQLKITRASFRGRFDDIDYLQIFLDLGIDAAGHKGAFGIKSFNPTKEIYDQLNMRIAAAEQGHVLTNQIIETPNLAMYCNTRAQRDSDKNCFVRDMFRTYIRYTGNNAIVMKETFKFTPLTAEDTKNGIVPDKVVDKVPCKFVLDEHGEKVRKYIEYSVDGRQVKSFGTDIKEGLILPIKERGHVQFYIHEPLME